MNKWICLFLFFSSNGLAGNLFSVSFSNATLTITTTPPNHIYTQASLEILSSKVNFSNADCNSVIQNRCLFEISNQHPKSIAIMGESGNIPIQLCLNGPSKISCQDYLIHISNTSSTVGSVTIGSTLNPLAYFSNNGGKSWGQPIIPTYSAGVTSVKLSAVSCLENQCIAAGYSDLSALFYLSHNRGETWGVPQTVENPTNASSTEINGLNCTSSGRCVAVGKTDVQGVEIPLTMISSNKGETWSVSTSLPSPLIPDSDSQLWGVSCSESGEYCVTAGWVVKNNANTPLIYISTDGGTSWGTGMTLEIPQDFNSGVLYSISCSSNAKNCVAVGYLLQDNENAQFPVSYYSIDGGVSWKANRPANLPYISQNSKLVSVSCSTNGLNCVTVGQLYTTDQVFNLVYNTHNGGISWSLPIVPSGPSNSTANKLNGVQCTPTGGICLAIGHGANSAGENLPYSYTTMDGGTNWIGPILMSTVSGTTDSDLFGVSGG